MSNVRIIFRPAEREEYINKLLSIDGLSHIKENPFSCYCPISLTQTPEAIKPYLLQRQLTLMNDILKPVGITAYDPSTAPFSPDINLTSLPQEIYLVDSGKIAGARFFVGHNILASTGVGVEVEKAVRFNRIAVMLFDKNIRVSRMQPHRVICLQYADFNRQKEVFKQVFQLLLQYDPGLGFDGNEPVLLGFHKETGNVVNLERLVYTTFPEIAYVFDGKRPTMNVTVLNPELFTEYNA